MDTWSIPSVHRWPDHCCYSLGKGLELPSYWPLGYTSLGFLIDADPLPEIHANFLLEQVGWLVYATTFASLSKFVNIRGYVLVNLDKPVMGQVQLDIADESTIKIEVQYKSVFLTFVERNGTQNAFVFWDGRTWIKLKNEG